MTVKEYLDAPWWKKLGYRLMRNPFNMFVLAPIVVNDSLEGLVGLRLTAVQALKKWGITEPEFQAMDLN